MRSILLLTLLTCSLNALAMSPKLVPLAKSIDKCFVDTAIYLCQDNLEEDVKLLDLNARGELVYFLKPKMKNASAEVITNLYTKFKALIPLYEALDGNDKWSTRDAKELVGAIAVEYVKITDINSDFLISLFKEQSVQSSRYSLLTTIHRRSQSVDTLSEINAVIKFAVFAKEYVKVMKDEYYLYESAVDLVKNMTEKLVALNPVHEGIYSIQFKDESLNSQIKIDTIAVMKSNSRDGLVITLNDSNAKLQKFVFTQAGILGETLFSNREAYENQLDFSAASLRFTLNRETGEIEGIFNSARFGAAKFVGTQVGSLSNVFENAQATDLTLTDLLDTYKVNIAGMNLNLVLRTRGNNSTKVEGALYNQNVLISFSKVTLNQDTGILELIDYQNKRKLALNVSINDGEISVNGLFFNVIMNKMMEISSK